jgi:hypothetical protein
LILIIFKSPQHFFANIAAKHIANDATELGSLPL